MYILDVSKTCWHNSLFINITLENSIQVVNNSMDSSKVERHNEIQNSKLKQIVFLKSKNKVTSGIEPRIFRSGISSVTTPP